LALAAILGGHLLGKMVARALHARNFDALFRLSGSSAPAKEAECGFTPTLIAGLVVRLTVWAGTAWALALRHGQVELAGTLGLILRRTWAVAAVLGGALALGGVLARRLIDCLQDRSTAEAPRNGPGASHRGVPGLVAAGAYVLAVLLVLLIAADSFDLPLTRNSAMGLWQFAQHLLIAVAALSIGRLGARWAHDLVTPGAGTASPEKRAGQYTALGIVAATTMLAVTLLLSSAAMLIGLAALALVVLLLWLVRAHIPDVVAGLQLRAQKVRKVWFDGEAWDVVEVGFLTTQVTRAGAFNPMQNRLVLDALLHGASTEAAPR
jgi:hypothetical protein